jgi:F-type H+-transporting ATPase subunit a
MALEFLARVRRATLALTVLAFLAGAVYANPTFGLAVLFGSLWSLTNLRVLESIGRLLFHGQLGGTLPVRDVMWTLAGIPALFLAGWALLASGFELLPLSIGFWLLFIVVVAKAGAIGLAKALDFATGRTAERPIDAVRRPLPARRAQGIVGWALLFVFAGAMSLWAFADPNPAPSSTSDPHATSTQAPAPAEHGSTDAHGATDEHAADQPAAGAHRDEHGEDYGGGATHLPTLPGVIAKLFPNAAWAQTLYKWEDLFFALLATTILVVLFRVGMRNPKLVPGRLQGAVETLATAPRDFLRNSFGPDMVRYTPFVGTIFFYILTMNYLGLVPLMKAPTSSLNTTAALAIVVFLYVLYTAVRTQGLFGYLHHLAGSPKDVVGWAVAPLMFPIELMGELIKPLSLAARLFGNIFGEDMLIALFVGIGAAIMAWQPVPVGFPIHVLFVFLALVMRAVQALVFALLSAVYLYMAQPHGDHDEEHHGAEGAQPAHA